MCITKKTFQCRVRLDALKEEISMIGLKLARIFNEYTCDTLTEKLSISRSLVSGWENNLKNIPKKRIKQLAELLNVSEEFIVTDFSKGELKSMLHLKCPSNEEILEVIKKEFPKADAVYEEKLISLIGNGAFKRLKDEGYIKLCGEIGGKKLYAI